MYGAIGSYGPMGPMGPGSPQGEYGAWFIPVLWGLGIGGAAMTVGSVVSSNMAASELERHTGGTYTLKDGTQISADEMHRRLCAAGLLDAETCARSPSEEAIYHADLPDGPTEHVLDTWVGSEERNRLLGNCDDLDEDGNPIHPGCKTPPKGLPAWVFAAVGIAAVAFLFMPDRKG